MTADRVDALDGRRPLDGIRVLDLSRVLAGPFCTQHLGEMGADVVKVEPPGAGDDTRGWGPPFAGDEDTRESLYFLAANRNKRSVVLDLRTDAGREAVRRLAAEADVLVENYRPGTLERWGLGYEQLAEANPRLVHVAITGFGQTGPYRDRPGYDLLAQAMGGIMSLTGEVGGDPLKVGLPVADLNAGTWAIIGVLMALHARHSTGRGQYLDVSLLDAQVVWHTYAAGAVFHDAPRPGRMGAAHPTVVPYQVFDAADGPLVVAVGSDRLFGVLCGVLRRVPDSDGPEVSHGSAVADRSDGSAVAQGSGGSAVADLADDPRFATNAGRNTHRDELVPRLAEVLATRTVAEWTAEFDAAGVPAGPVNSLDDLYADPWATERDQIVRLDHPGIGTYVGTGFPVKASATPARPSGPPPRLGEHSAEVLAEIGFDAEHIAEATGETRPGEP